MRLANMPPSSTHGNHAQHGAKEGYREIYSSTNLFISILIWNHEFSFRGKTQTPCRGIQGAWGL